MGIRQKLKKYDIRPQVGDLLEIADVGRDDLALFIGRTCKKGAEIGVAEGDYSLMIMQANPKMKMYGIDPYMPYEDYKDFVLRSTFQKMRQSAGDKLDKFKGYEFINKTSEDAVGDFKDGSLDFVYLDGNHDYTHAMFDITEWSKKVKKGGIVSGHDYARLRHGGSKNWGVLQAITRYTKDNHIQLYIWGLNGKNELKRDNSRSWMYIRE
jgi:hypothetical protein